MKKFDNIKLCIFDAYGTLFNINSVTEQCLEELGNIAEPFTSLWRSKQLEYSWLRSLMNRYEDFWCVTEESLDYSLNYFNIKNDSLKINLLKAYENISCYEEVPTILSKLKERKISTAILSNASTIMLNKAIKNSKIDFYIDSCFSVDTLKIYKPHPTVYNLVLEKYNLNKNEILFISSNSWDVAGAKSFGFNVSWINRFNSKEEVLPFKCDIELSSLTNLPTII
ncbi:haloacid dehalogenase type II [Clostridium saccharobutylicum]|uniref:(S)-2-haloacid dehalogenase 4A n=1 Tax=Clostridium saccharobutylicum TaxID=169679 RepID=A0A1S8MNY3_CLOSA|nr:haloacid dehalogenase type II [Clostridium saccharobutylicum]OOM05896.1 (S)-2-haloacid dehalogenase 4A [Clostridium saccharobutylicum]